MTIGEAMEICWREMGLTEAEAPIAWAAREADSGRKLDAATLRVIHIPHGKEREFTERLKQGRSWLVQNCQQQN